MNLFKSESVWKSLRSMGWRFNQNTEPKTNIKDYMSSTYSFITLLLLKLSQIEQKESGRYKLQIKNLHIIVADPIPLGTPAAWPQPGDISEINNTQQAITHVLCIKPSIISAT